MVTAGMIGGATYATTSSTTDVYYACASLTGNIRASSIRLNSAPTRCSSTTDHIVQWDAAGQPIQPKAGRLITLEAGKTYTREAASPTKLETLTWPAVDTSECKGVIPILKFESQVTDPDPTDLTALQIASASVSSEGYYGTEEVAYRTDTYRSVSPNYFEDLRFAPPRSGSLLTSLRSLKRDDGLSAAEESAQRTALEISISSSPLQVGFGGPIDRGIRVIVSTAALYCTPY